MTMTAEETAPADAIPLGSYRALRAWREHREAALAVPLTAETAAAVKRCQAGMMLHAMEQQAGYLQPLPMAEPPLPKRVPQPYSTHPHAPFPAAEVSPERDPFTAEVSPQPPESPMHGFTPMPGSEEALANVEKRAEEEALAQHEAASRADLGRWAKGETFDDDKASEAVENLLDHHDTDAAGEPAAETAIIPGLEDEPASE